MNTDGKVCINDYLTNDPLSCVFKFIDTPREWKKIGKICKFWKRVSDTLKEEKARQFSKIDIKNNSQFISTGPNSVVIYECTESYFYLPNQRLHGILTKTISKRLRYTDKFIEHKRITKKFKWGDQVSKEHIENLLITKKE